MNDDNIADLKQFITTTLRQEVSGVKDEIIDELRSEIRSSNDELGIKIHELSSSVADAMDNNSEQTDKQLENHEQRITKLETKTV